MADSVWIFTLVPLSIVVIIGTLAFFIGYRGVLKRQSAEDAPKVLARKGRALPAVDEGLGIRGSAHMVAQAPDEKAVLVQFVDFASESCRSIQPYMKDLTQEFGHNVTFISRHFPRPGDINSEAAAVAVEAAAQQGKFIQMTILMYETQSQWAASGETTTCIFRGLAADLGLDIVKFSNAVADPRTKEKVEADKAYGASLGVRCTPTFFLLDGEMMEAESLDQFRQMVSNAARK